MKKQFWIYVQFMAYILIGLLACEDEPDLYEKKFTSESLSLITAYLNENENTAMMAKLLELGNRDGLLNTYGNYTVFAPVDSAFSTYLSSIGKSNINELDSSEINQLVDFHVMFNLIDVKTKTTGVLGGTDTTMSGLRHFIDLSEGFGNIVINKKSRIIKITETSNGIVYVIDHVIEPRPVNIYDYLVSTGEYNILIDAIDAVNLQDTLQNVKYPDPLSDIPDAIIKPYLTVFAETDALFNAKGINSVEDLKSKVWNTNAGQATNAEEALADFVLYHLIPAQRSSYSMYKQENLTTLSMEKTGIIHISPSADIRKPIPVLNAGYENSGIKLEDINSDVSCINGLVHQLKDGVLFINTDYTQSTIIKECEEGLRIVSTRDMSFLYSEDIKVGGRGILSSLLINQQFYSTPGDEIGLGLQFTPVDNNDWMEITIRNVVPGSYTARINFYRSETGSSENINVYFRNENEEFSWETQLLKAGFDMAQSGSDLPQYRQDLELGTITVEEYGNYIFRFAHVDNKYGIYDNILLVPVN